jgi:hypothetical protein
MFGGPLLGDNAVKFLFMDEAGKSGAAHENWRVVVGLIVDADRELVLLEAGVEDVMRSLPEKYRNNAFAFSAKAIWGDGNLRDDWNQTDRMAFLRNMMSLPRRAGIPIAYGAVRSDQPPHPGLLELGMSEFDAQTFMAFSYCMTRADKYIRERCAVGEIGTAIAEQSDLNKWVKLIPRICAKGMRLSDDQIEWTPEEKGPGFH